MDTDNSNDVVLLIGTRNFTKGSRVSSFTNSENQRHMAVVKLEVATGEEIWRYQELPPYSPGTATRYFGAGTSAGVAVDGEVRSTAA